MNEGEGSSTKVLDGLNVAIIGGGPSGLLLAHRLLKSGSSVSLFESRGDPRILSGAAIDSSRAYALGIGIRGRTAIKTVDEELWQLIKSRGFPCDKFHLHLNPSFKIKLRDDERDVATEGLEASILLFQTDLCSVLLDELENRYGETSKLKLFFNSKVSACGLIKNGKDLIQPNTDIFGKGAKQQAELFDLVVGCDGFRSNVRKSMEAYAPNIVTTQMRELPGLAKVVTLPAASSKRLDAKSVHLLLPSGSGAGSVTAFIEPTVRGSCVLFAGRVSEESTSEHNGENHSLQLMDMNTDIDADQASALGNAVREAFPLLEKELTDEVVLQVAKQRPFASAVVKANTYNCGLFAICGDAAHATGGVSGQGCNSALCDSATLANCLEKVHSDSTISGESDRCQMVGEALLAYSKQAVPEGTALFELAIGPDEPTSTGRRILSTISAAFDFVFRGGRTIQRILGTSLQSFSDIRQMRDLFFDKNFPDAAEFEASLEKIHADVMEKLSPDINKVAVFTQEMK
eukprot:CAMPEP_0196807488 /NCGR_PEP_ID=MMETSP1362-20130617/7472_1 /TAXON_ID=163516 /ORGANISM="Leptocylindrus danicus, Strain CCMP1856" /LENGTH=516 /DNA_ID=CAMNT_0042181437 /DNA_START=147 /DNA_END=1697 /DNA_ORIENTATION=-